PAILPVQEPREGLTASPTPVEPQRVPVTSPLERPSAETGAFAPAAAPSAPAWEGRSTRVPPPGARPTQGEVSGVAPGELSDARTPLEVGAPVPVETAPPLPSVAGQSAWRRLPGDSASIAAPEAAAGVVSRTEPAPEPSGRQTPLTPAFVERVAVPPR